MALLLLDEPLHFCSHCFSFLFHLSLTHVLIFVTQNKPLLGSLSPKTSSIPFHSSTHHLSKASLPAFPIEFMESLSTQSLKLKTLQLSSTLSLPYQADHPGFWPMELHIQIISRLHFSSHPCFGSNSHHLYLELLQQPPCTSFYQVSFILQPNFHTTTTTTTTRIIYLKYESDWVTPLLKL